MSDISYTTSGQPTPPDLSTHSIRPDAAGIFTVDAIAISERFNGDVAGLNAYRVCDNCMMFVIVTHVRVLC